MHHEPVVAAGKQAAAFERAVGMRNHDRNEKVGIGSRSRGGLDFDSLEGDALVIPKGWKGNWTTSGYQKFFVDYKGD